MELLDLLRNLLPAVVVLGLLAAGLHIAKKRGLVAGPSAGGRQMTVTDRVRLTPQHQLHRVQTVSGTFLIATFQGGCSLIEAERETTESANRANARGAACG